MIDQERDLCKYYNLKNHIMCGNGCLYDAEHPAECTSDSAHCDKFEEFDVDELIDSLEGLE